MLYNLDKIFRDQINSIISKIAGIEIKRENTFKKFLNLFQNIFSKRF
ncbi:MAG: hypothetical protein QXW35_00225 [Candidatus Aenigmatarchaeota archaeon]